MIRSTNSEARLPISNPGWLTPGGPGVYLTSLPGFPHSHGGRRQWHPTPVLLPGKSCGQRSLVGCSPWDCPEGLPLPGVSGGEEPRAREVGGRRRSPSLQADSIPSEPPGKAKNTGMGSLSTPGIFPTQESNQGLLHFGGFFTFLL